MNYPRPDNENVADFFSSSDVPKILFQAMLQSIKDPFRIVDQDYRLLWINNEEPRHLIGQICFKTVFERDEPCTDCPVTMVFETKKPAKVQKVLTLPDGSEAHWEIRAYPVFDKESNLLYAITIGHDIKDRYTNLAKLQRHIDTLEKALYDMAKSTDSPSFESVPEVTISQREFEVLRLMAEGLTNPEISKVLGISPNTVKSHVLSIFNKLGVSDRTQAAVVATRLRLI